MVEAVARPFDAVLPKALKAGFFGNPTGADLSIVDEELAVGEAVLLDAEASLLATGRPSRAAVLPIAGLGFT